MTLDFATWHQDVLAGDEVPRWAHSRDVALEVFESMQPPPKPVAEVDEIAILRSEVTRLRKRLATVESWSRRTLVSAIGDALAHVRREVAARVEALEQREPDHGVTLPSQADIAAATRRGNAVYDQGLWNTQQYYQAGDLTTHANASWVATVASRGLKPGDGAGWRLIHKTEQGHVRKLIRQELAQQQRQKGPALR